MKETGATRLRRLHQHCGQPWTRDRGLIVAGLFATLAMAGVSLLRPLPLRGAMEILLPSPQSKALVSWLPQHRDTALWACGGAWVLIALLQGGFLAARTLSLGEVAQRSVNALRASALRHLVTLSPLRSMTRTGDLVLRLTQDMNAIRVLVTGILVDSMTALIMGVLFVGALFFVDVPSGILVAGCIPLFAGLASRAARRTRKAADHRRLVEGQAAARTEESIRGMRAVQAFSRGSVEQEAYEEAMRDSMDDSLSLLHTDVGLARSFGALSAVALGALLYINGLSTLRGSSSPGELLVILAYGQSALSSWAKFFRARPRMAEATSGIDRVLEIFEEAPALPSLLGVAPLEQVEGRLEFDNVTFGYLPDRPVLRQVSLIIEPGQVVALVGATGSGKSTILDLLLRLEDPWSGAIRIDGRDIRKIEPHSLRRAYRVMLQEPYLFPRSVRENLALGQRGASDARLRRAAERAGIARLIESLPRGYDTRVGERGARLSGGQRQGIALARMLLSKGTIALLDEPQAGLDAKNEARFIRTLHHLSDGRTMIVVAHRFATVQAADRVIYLRDGVIAASGTHEELYRSVVDYRDLCNLQFGNAEAMASSARVREASSHLLVAGMEGRVHETPEEDS